MSGPRLAAVEHVLDQVRGWEPVYRRWWDHPCRRGHGGVEPWSAEDEERWAWLSAIEPERMAAVAGELRWVSAELATHQAGLAEFVALGGIPKPAAQWCASLARAADDRATDAALLAEAVDRVARDADGLLNQMVGRVLRAAAALDKASTYPSPGLAHLEIDVADQLRQGVPRPDRWHSLDTFVERHGVVLAELRAYLAGAADRLGLGPRAGLGVWCDGDVGCLPTPHPASPPGPELPVPPAGVWISEPWHPLRASPDSGPLLPGTEGSRPGTETGVRVAQLPDRPVG
ncbi:MAG: hypothetical protein J2P19_18045 [Pseudonocardia sp.]|nr:hypothetical protein [Pseudonocardia sp.]